MERHRSFHINQSDFAVNFVAVFLVAVENVAPQHCPVEVRTWATTPGDFCSGNGESARSSFPALTSTFALSAAPALSSTFMMPSGAPVLLLNFQPIEDSVQQAAVPHPPVGCPWYALKGTPPASS